jgi:signal transduction histidine kinase
MILAPDTPRFTILAVNKAYCAATYKEHSALLGRALFEAFPDNADNVLADGVDKLGLSLTLAISRKQPQHLHKQRFDIPGPGTTEFTPHYWEVINVPVLDEAGNVTCVIHSVEDISTRVMLQQQADELRQRGDEVARQISAISEEKAVADENRALLEAVIDIAQAGIFLFTPIFDAEGKITDFRFRFANRMLCAYVGQTPEVIIGRPGSEWFPGYKANGLFERYSQTAMTGSSQRFEFHYNNDGIDVWLDIMCTKVGDEVLVTFTDHTSLKNLQRRLEEHVEELRSSNANLEQFAYVASHDLQEPLRKIKSFGNMLQGRYGQNLGAEGGDLINRMQSAANRMSILIEDLLTYSRVSVKPAQMKVLQTDKILEEALFDLERLIHQKAAVIKADKLAPVAGQATQIGQLFQNVLSNALKFSHPSRKPEIRISSEMVTGQAAPIAVARADAARLFQMIRIRDNGIGFEPGYKDRIFQIFQRLHNRSEYPGTGVGLSIVKKVVANHNGYIEADAIPGEGTTFTILLPAVVREEM